MTILSEQVQHDNSFMNNSVRQYFLNNSTWQTFKTKKPPGGEALLLPSFGAVLQSKTAVSGQAGFQRKPTAFALRAIA
ncbi:hypothetical protein [Treponema sp.]|uniref:hypothetical protein n=1 Tax=Treponema sp. TaxID=166 RepID=UPI003F089CE4